MRLFYISSGKQTLSDLNPNMIEAFRKLEKKLDHFAFSSFLLLKEPKHLLQEKIRYFRPDLVLVFGHDNHGVLPFVKKFGVPVGLWVVNDPYHLDNYRKKARSYDFILTQESSCVSFYQKMNKPCLHIPLAVNSDKYHPMTVPVKYQSDICFVGNGWPTRLRFFDQVIPFLMKKNFILIGERWDGLKHYNKLKSHILKGLIPPSETAKYYNGAKIVLNIHRSHNDVNKNSPNLPAYTPNNRSFDIAACRAFQLATWRQDFGKYYRMGKEIVCYQGIEDFKKKIQYYLSHDEEREQIALRSYRRTLKDHTYEVRLYTLIKKLEKHILKNGNKKINRLRSESN